MTSPYTYIPHRFYPFDTDMMDHIWSRIWWEHRDNAPRYEAWMNDFGQSYTYGRGEGQRTYQSGDWHAGALALRDSIKEQLGFHLEGCFINGYRDGKDHLGWHADDDPVIDHEKPIVVVSIGAERDIYIRHVSEWQQDTSKIAAYGYMPLETPGPIEKVRLLNGSMLIMHPGMQFTHQHKIAKSDRPVGKRISFTFRGLYQVVKVDRVKEAQKAWAAAKKETS